MPALFRVIGISYRFGSVPEAVLKLSYQAGVVPSCFTRLYTPFGSVSTNEPTPNRLAFQNRLPVPVVELVVPVQVLPLSVPPCSMQYQPS